MTESLELAERILKQLELGQDVYNILTNHIENEFIIKGKTLAQWRRHFKCEIPADCNLSKLRENIISLHNIYQEAHLLYAEAQAQFMAIQRGGEKLFREAHHSQVSKYEARKVKLPSADTLKREAEFEIGEIKDAEKQAVIVKNFWKEIVSSLEGQRKLMEQLSINLSVESKFSRGGDSVPQTKSRGSYGHK